MKNDDFERLEAENAELLSLMSKQAAADNSILSVPPRKWSDTGSVQEDAGKPRFRISPYWLAAAMLAGFVLGIAFPRTNTSHEYGGSRYTAAYNVDSCRSLQENDVNLSLLVSM